MWAAADLACIPCMASGQPLPAFPALYVVVVVNFVPPGLRSQCPAVWIGRGDVLQGLTTGGRPRLLA